MKCFGKSEAKVDVTLGAEQEYFLVDKNFYLLRPDLIMTGRTLFGSPPPKHQQLEDHYFGTIKMRVLNFMNDVERELWTLGIPAKTRHNEVAPCQHEMAPIFTTTNLSADQNQLTMEIMKKVAKKHNLVCILHEKPFAGVNGSGKHNNWSLSTNTGENLLEPGNTPEDNAQFLLVLTAIIKAVDEYQDLLRLSVAFAGNDHRLGADEAPPAIISIFLGDELTAILEAIMSGKPYDKKAKEVMKLGVDILPAFPKDNTDRNRTSPFAFTGNKFEFRSLGSSMSISCPNIMLNTITAEALCQFADELEKADDFNTALNALIKKTLNEHKRIIFNGDGYSQEWVDEAERRGLSNLKTTTDALPRFLDEKNIQLFLKHKVHTQTEIEARYKIQMEDYCKVLNIEVMTMLEMVKREISPAVINFTKDVADSALSVKSLLGEEWAKTQIDLVKTLSALTDVLTNTTAKLESTIGKIKDYDDVTECAKFYTSAVIPAMNDVRQIADKLETIVGSKYWPFPTYADLLFRI
jgi:glutamine synthetase